MRVGFDPQTVHVENSNPERTRRDAIAHCLCARICDDRRTIHELEALDRALTSIERAADPIEVGLRELAENAPHDWPGPYELGGEG